MSPAKTTALRTRSWPWARITTAGRGLDRALLRELQGAVSHPSVSVLLGTNPGAQMTSLDVSRLHHLATRARLRLEREVRGDQLSSLEERLGRAIDLAQSSASHEGLAVLVSAGHMMVVRLPFEPRDRAVVDPTFRHQRPPGGDATLPSLPVVGPGQ